MNFLPNENIYNRVRIQWKLLRLLHILSLIDDYFFLRFFICDIQTPLMNVPVLPVSMEIVQTNIFITNVSVIQATQELIVKVVRKN
jgi:hypothetical protein